MFSFLNYHKDLQDIALDRRAFLRTGLQAGAVLAAGAALPSPAAAAVFANGRISTGARRVSFRNAHTGESFSGVYRVGNKYLPDAFDQINVVLRDFRSGDVFPIDPRVIDIIHAVHEMAGLDGAYEVLSGYRSPKTNAMLRRVSTGVAKRSLHMSGQAIDVRLPGFSTQQLKKLAVGLEAGGVGYYASSDFVHMDTGEVRSW